MKVIDLLNKIAKGEKVPKKIKYDVNRIYEYVSVMNNYFCEYYDDYLLDNCDLDILNNEVEIIEEEKAIEKLSFCDFAITINENASNNDRILMDKINELIDVINDMRYK